MTETLRRRLVHFRTEGDITADFEAARRKKVRALRRVIHSCFYYQCAAAAGCIAASLILGAGAAAAAVIIGAVAAVMVAFLSVGGGTAEKTIVYILDLAYAVICFTAGAMADNGAPFYVCGIIMLTAALAALGGFFAAYMRDVLEKTTAADLTAEDYDMTPNAHAAEHSLPKKSELRVLAEQFAEKMR